MPITTYLPTKLSSEATRFKTNSGNIKLDYRSATGSAPYLFSTPFTLSRLNSLADIMPPIVPTEDHVTGDNTNYRRYTMDIAVASDDYQRNVVFLHLDGELIEVAYKKTIYLEYLYEGSLVRELEHHYTLVNDLDNSKAYSTVNHLLLNAEEVVDGFVDTQKVVRLKRDTSFDFVYTMYTVDLGDGDKGILLTQETDTDYGANESVVSPAMIPSQIKELKYFTGSLESTADDSFKTNTVYSSSFAKNGSVFSATNNTVLTDSNPNFYLYSKSIDFDQDVVGYSFNISPTRGSLLHLINQSDDRNYIFTGTTPVIGKSYTYFGTEYTGLVSSPFLLLNFDFTSQTDTFKLKIDNEAEVIVGDYTASTFKYLCARLSDLLYEKGILVIPCKNNKIAFDRFDGEDPVELVLTALYTKITTVPKFTSFEYLGSTKTVVYDPVLHPVNFTFTYVDEIDPDPELPSTYPLVYKLNITKDTGRDTEHVSYKVRLNFNIPSVRNTTQAFKLEVEEDILDTTFTINDTDSIETVLDAIATEINTFLPSNYSVEVSYLTSAIDIVNNQATETTYIKVTTGTWMTIDPVYGGVYVENPDSSKTMIMKPNDGSSTITTDTGIIAIDAASTYFDKMGVSTYNPVNGTFSSLTLVSFSTMFSAYCYALQTLNSGYRQYGYEVIPLYESGTSNTSSYFGLSKIVNNSSQTKPVIIANTKQAAYENGLYKSAKDMFMTTSQDGTRSKIIKGNASIVEWKDKVITGENKARPFEIREVTPSLYKKTVSGKIANRDGLVLTSIRPSSNNSYDTSHYNTRTLNIATGDPTAISGDIFLSLTQPEGSVSFSQSHVGDVYTCEGMGYRFDYDNITKEFTLTTSLELTTVTCLGFTQPNDVIFEDYAGWIKYPVGLNSSTDKFNLLETNPYIYMLVISYNQIIDGV